MISVITATTRPEGIRLVEKALKRQTYKDFEWVIVAPEQLAIATSINILRINDPKPEPGDVWTLNKAYNQAIKAANGELVVSWQDWAYAKPDALEKFWTHYELDNKKIVSGVGNKYSDDSWTVMIWKDPRQRSDQGTFYPCYFNDIEWNFCALPKKALYSVGGFDETLDKWFGMDGYSVLDRLNMVGGWDFHLDQTNESFSLEHGRPARWEELNAIHGPYNERRLAYLANPVLPYL